MARPRKFTPQIEAELLERLALGETVSQICSEDRFPVHSYVFEKAAQDSEFADKYVRARELGYLKMAEEILDIADDGRNDWMTKKVGNKEVKVVDREAVERSRLRLDARKWLLSKALPKVYGDKLDLSAKHEAGDSFKELWAALAKGKLG
jgi:hypothetical protein